MPDPTQSDPSQNPVVPPAPTGDSPTGPAAPANTSGLPPAFSPAADLPPLPPAFQNLQGDNSATPAASSSDKSPQDSNGSAAPADLPPVVSNPKKKFGTGRIIATILGILLLVGGIGAGIFLTGQQQLFQQKASQSVCDNGTAQQKRDAGCGNNCPSGSYSCTRGCCAVFSGETVPNGGGGNAGTGNGGTGSTTCSVGASRTCTLDGQSGTQVCHLSADGTGTWDTCTVSSTSTSTCSACRSSASGVANPSTCDSVCGTTGGNSSGCGGSNLGCSNGYICSSGACIPDPTKAAVGGAPIGCNRGCDSGDIVCEPPARKECKTTGASGTKWCLIEANSPDCGGGGGGGGNPTGQCLNVKAYSSTWALLNSSQLSALQPNTVVNFCVAGSATSGTFDKAQFKVNSTLDGETTTKGQGAAASNYCQSYTIQATDTAVNVKAKIHHATLGWFGEAI